MDGLDVAATPASETGASSRVLLVTSELPRPGSAGHLTYEWTLLSALAHAGIAIEVLVLRPKIGGLTLPFDAFLSDPALRRNVTVDVRGTTRVGDRLVVFAPMQILKLLGQSILGERWRQAFRRRFFRSGADVVLGGEPNAAARAWALRRIAESSAQTLVASTIFLAFVAHAPRRERRRVLIAHDLFAERRRSFESAGCTVQPSWIDRESEQERLAAFDAAAMISVDEQRTVSELAPLLATAFVPPVITPPAVPPTPPTAPRRFVFIGGDGPHNVAGLAWLIQEVWPQVRRAAPNAQLDICGAIGRQISAPEPGVRVCGRVPDLRSHLLGATAGLLPMRTGSGLNVKALDYLGAGLPCVTTEVGARGFPERPARPFAVADAPEAFASAMVDLASDDALQHSLAIKAHAYSALFALDTVGRSFFALIDGLEGVGAHQRAARAAPETDG